MSLLLDALNKADQERKRNETTPGINSKHDGYLDHHPSTLTLPIILALSAALLAIASAVYWLEFHSTNTTQVPIAAITRAAQIASKSTHSSSSIAEQTSTSTAAEVPDENTVDASVASLYQQNEIASANAAAAAAANAPIANTLPTTPAPAINAPITIDPAAPTSIAQFANLPEIHDLPRDLLEKIPSLNYSQHNFTNGGGSVVINGFVRHANEQLANGLVIDKILEDGMILHIDNFSFKMRALNSWINM